MPTQYRLTGRIETGDLAELYLAERDATPGRAVVKLFHPKTSDIVYARELAETSRRLLARPSTGIVPYRELGLVRGRLAVVRDWVEGQTLGRVLGRLTSREVTLPVSLGVWLFSQLVEAVARAHELLVVHGALTPGNVLIEKNGAVGVCDFGVLRALQSSTALRPFAADGRNVYRAPEVQRGEIATPRSDIYSLGAIGYELVTLREATEAPPVGSRSEPLVPPSRIDGRIPTRLDALLMKALELDPQLRFTSTQELAAALREYLTHEVGHSPREDVQRFFGTELFPAHMSLLAQGPVPFAEPFSLEPIRGAELGTTPGGPGGVLPERGFALAPPPVVPTSSGGWQSVGEREPEPLSSESPGPAALVTSSFEEAFTVSPEDGGDAPSMPPPPPAQEITEPPAPARITSEQPLDLPDRATRSMTPLSEEAAVLSDTAEDSSPPHRTAPEMAATKSGGWRRPLRWLSGLVALAGVAAFGYTLWRSWEETQRREGRQAPADASPAPIAVAPVAPSSTNTTGTDNDVELDGGLPSDAGGIAAVTTPAAAGDAGSSAVDAGSELALLPNDPDGLGVEPPTLAGKQAKPIKWHLPAPRTVAALISVDTNLPAKVFIDGLRVKWKTPLTRYPVRPGKRTIVIEAIATGQRSEYTVELKRGRLKRFEEEFEPVPRRR